VDWLVEANVSEKRGVSTCRVEDGDSKLLRNVSFLSSNPHDDLTQKNITRIASATNILNLTSVIVGYLFELVIVNLCITLIVG
jgi:hypothetical protein